MWNIKETTEEPVEKEKPRKKSLYEYNYLTLEKDLNAVPVNLYRNSTKKVHPDKRRHALIHEHFCKYHFCKYHTTF